MVLKNRLVVGCWLLIIGLLLTSCKKKVSVFDDSQVFRYNEHSNISSLDPAFAKKQADIWAMHQLYNGLVQLDDSLHVQPDIAKKWSISGDGKTYTFTLRNDVYFHKHHLFGNDFTRVVKATDFKYSFDRLLDTNVASPGGWVLQNVAKYSAKNDSTFVINLKKPFPPFLGLLSMKYCSVVPKEIVEQYGNNFRSNPIGTGPFKFKIWIENTKLVFRKNEIYYEKDEKGNKLPYLEAVAITFLPDKQSEFLQLVQGNIDFLSGLDASFKDDILTVEGNLKNRYSNQLNMITGAYLNTEYLGNGFIPKGLPSFNNLKGYNYQPDEAKRLVNEFKIATGNQNPEIAITTNSQYVDLCEYIQRELEKTGLKVNIDVIPPSTLRQSKASNKLPIFRASWIADYPDAENYLSLFYSKNFTPNGPNYTHFKNETFDNLYEEAFVTVSDENRYQLYQQMDSIIIRQAPIVPLYYDAVVRFSQKNVDDLGMNPINLLTLKNVSKTKQ